MKPQAIYSPDPARGWLPWGALAPILCILIVAAPMLSVSSVERSLGLVDARGEPTGLPGLYSMLVVEFGLTGLLVLAWVRFVERRSLATIGLSAVARVWTFVGGLGIGFATSLTVVAAIGLAGGYRADGFALAFQSPMALLQIGFLLICFAVQSSVEEVLFRGWLLSAVARKFNVPLAVLLTSLVFTFLHYGPHQPWREVSVSFLFSLFACSWALRTNNIWGVMGWHSGWNWLISAGFEVPITGLDVKLPALLVRLIPVGPEWLTGGKEGPEGSVLCSLFFLLAISAIAWSAWRARRTLDPT